MDVTPYIAPAVTILVSLVGGYFAVVNAITRIVQGLRVDVERVETKVDILSERVERHNGVMERTSTLEADMENAFHRIGELKDRDDKIEAKIERLHV